MKSLLRTIVPILFFCTLSMAADAPPKLNGFPFEDETLRFNVNWATGVSLGQASMAARRIEDERWEFLLTLDASVPGFTIKDRYKSIATRDLCSVEFERESEHGTKKLHETVKFQPDRNNAHRATNGNGGSSDFRVPDCAKDALAFLYFTRFEMGQGRVPLPTTVVFGGPYEIEYQYIGEESLKNNVVTDKLVSTARGASAIVTFDILFARDAARRPLIVRSPFPLGTFSLELIR